MFLFSITCNGMFIMFRVRFLATFPRQIRMTYWIKLSSPNYYLCLRTPLDRKKPVKERSILTERHAQILRGYPVRMLPVLFQSTFLIAETLCQTLHYLSDQFIRLLDRPLRLIHKTGLNIVPARSQIVFFLRR